MGRPGDLRDRRVDLADPGSTNRKTSRDITSPLTGQPLIEAAQKSSYLFFSADSGSLSRNFACRNAPLWPGARSLQVSMTTPAMVTYPCFSHALPFRTVLRNTAGATLTQDLAMAVTQYVLKQSQLPDDPEKVWLLSGHRADYFRGCLPPIARRQGSPRHHLARGDGNHRSIYSPVELDSNRSCCANVSANQPTNH